MPEQIRTFIAIELEEKEKDALGELQDRLKAERAARYIRWVAPQAIHATLKFLGDMNADQLAPLQRAIADVTSSVQSFTLSLEGIGAFPNMRRPNIVWVGIGGDVEAVVRLAEQIDSTCARLGFARETRPFSPHLTLGRVKRDARPADQQFVGEMIANAQAGEMGVFRVDHVSVMKSDLRPTGSVYTRMAVCSFQ